jgi:predicted Zn finger-like uncharacterized protein
MALFITQCPYCQTTFRTSVSQLQSAEGVVRCGACLKVFVADDNLIPSADLRTVEKPVRDEPDEPEDPAETESLDLQVREPVFTLDPDTAPEDELEPDLGDPGSHWEILDEATVVEEARAVPAESDNSPEQSASAEDNAPQPHPRLMAHEPAIEKPLPMQSFSALDDDFTILQPSIASTAAPAFSRADLAAIARAGDALEIDWQDREAPATRSGWWAVAAIFLIATLAGQFVFFKWAELGQNAMLRPGLESLCRLLPCSLAPMIDLRSIRSENLVIRSHSEIANALNVTLSFRNDSAFDQALPVLNLHFMNADNEVIAARQFSPLEYLPVELANLELLPAGAPVQVSFDIIDPGIEAINYEVSFVSPQSR